MHCELILYNDTNPSWNEKLYPRLVGSRSLSSFKLSRGVLARTYPGYVRVNVHWKTLWIRKAAQAHLSLGDCSTTARRSHRIAGVVVAPVMLANPLGIPSWICTPVRLVLRYSAWTCKFTFSVILFDPVGVDPTFQLGPCLRNPVQRSLPGFNLFSWSVLSCRLMCWIHG